MNITVKGIGVTKFGELWDKTLADLALEASLEAIKDSGIEAEKIDAVYVANMISGITGNQEQLGPLVTNLLKIHSSSVHIEAACASGGAAVHQACLALESGLYKNILVVGVEKMTDQSAGDIAKALMAASSQEEREVGLTFPGLYALLAKAHMAEYDTTKEQLAAVAEKNHFHGSLNPKAQFPFSITIEKALKSGMIASPLGLLDCSPITDGAAAVVLSNNGKKNDVKIVASATASDSLGLIDRVNLTSLQSTQLAAKGAYKQVGLKPSDIDVAEVHDCFTIAEILAIEDLGFAKKGQGGLFAESGASRLGGQLPINTSGGLKSCGHPVGATGVKQIAEIVGQLRGNMGDRQVKNAKVGLAHNVGGSGATAVVHILMKGEKVHQ
jgi:acetyl-CoA C-acetyltransferase